MESQPGCRCLRWACTGIPVSDERHDLQSITVGKNDPTTYQGVRTVQAVLEKSVVLPQLHQRPLLVGGSAVAACPDDGGL